MHTARPDRPACLTAATRLVRDTLIYICRLTCLSVSPHTPPTQLDVTGCNLIRKGCRQFRAQYMRRTPHTQSAPVENMRVDHRRRNIPVPKELLHRPNVGPTLQHMRRETVPQGMTPRPFPQPRLAHRSCHRPLHHGWMQMMPAPLSGLSVHVVARSREHPLPRPRGGGVRILPHQRPGQSHPTPPHRQVLYVLRPHPLQMPSEIPQRNPRQHRHTVSPSLGPLHPQLPALQVHVLDPQRQPL